MSSVEQRETRTRTPRPRWSRRHAGRILIAALIIGTLVALVLVLTVGQDALTPGNSIFDRITSR